MNANEKTTETEQAADVCAHCENKWCDGTDCRPGRYLKRGGLLVAPKRFYGSIGNP